MNIYLHNATFMKLRCCASIQKLRIDVHASFSFLIFSLGLISAKLVNNQPILQSIRMTD
jgi:hypothetical protein